MTNLERSDKITPENIVFMFTGLPSLNEVHSALILYMGIPNYNQIFGIHALYNMCCYYVYLCADLRIPGSVRILLKKSNLIGQLHGYILLKSNTLYLYTCGVLYELSCASLDQSLKIFRIVKVLLLKMFSFRKKCFSNT